MVLVHGQSLFLSGVLECEVSVVGGGWNDSALQGYVYMAMSLLPPTFPRATLIKVG